MSTTSVDNPPHLRQNIRLNPDTGFPFEEDDFEGGHSFRSQLDEIAQRHPEFAQHLNFDRFSSPHHQYPQGGRRRRGSDERTQPPPENRRFDRPFRSRFEDFGFPFSGREFNEGDFYPEREFSRYQEVPREDQSERENREGRREDRRDERGNERGNETRDVKRDEKRDEKDYEKGVERSEERKGDIKGDIKGEEVKKNIQQSNTVDLGKNQDPIEDQRGQRSMSAPPENRPAQQRFVSSINIPVQGAQAAGGDSNMGGKPSQQEKPTERVIPIHVEGRDEPVLPKNPNFTPSQQPQQQQPQPERIFGRNPSHFTQFLNKGEPQINPDDIFKQQKYQKQQQQGNYQQPNYQQSNYQQPNYQQSNYQQPNYQQANYQQSNYQQPNYQQSNYQQQPNYQQQQHFGQQNVPQQNYQEFTQQDVPSQHQQSQQPQQEQKKPVTQLDQIQNIQKDVSELMNRVEKFNGKPKDKEYLYLDEMLTRNLIKLDNIETEGKDNIRQARKEAIKCIESCIGILEAKANANLGVKVGEEKQEEGEEVKMQEEGDKIGKGCEGEEKGQTDDEKCQKDEEKCQKDYEKDQKNEKGEENVDKCQKNDEKCQKNNEKCQINKEGEKDEEKAQKDNQKEGENQLKEDEKDKKEEKEVEKMIVEAKNTEQDEQTQEKGCLEVSGVTRTGSFVNTQEKETPMEVECQKDPSDNKDEACIKSEEKKEKKKTTKKKEKVDKK